MLSRLLRTVREHALLERGDRVLVAASGGPDSTALLHGLLTLAPRLGISLCAACVDHGLRPESADEARAVVERCRAWGIAASAVTVDVGKAMRRHVSVQEAARIVRLAALAETAKQLGCTKIALGHTADDQAETVLFRIVRGTGLRGLSGIPYRRDSLIRPLLDVRRHELLAYLAKRKIAFVSDPSNANPRYARSRIRHQVLPALARENPRVVESLLSLSREAQRGQEAGNDKDRPHLPRRAAETLRRLVREGRGTRQITAKGGAIVVGYGQVSWQPTPVVPPAPLAADHVISPSGGQFRLFAPPAPAIEVLAARRGPRPPGDQACFDVARLAWPLSLRTRRPGDRMVPRFGLGSRKLSDLLIDAKVPRRERSTLPLLCDAAGTILFVPGLRPAEAGRPSSDTQEWVEVRVAR